MSFRAEELVLGRADSVCSRLPILAEIAASFIAQDEDKALFVGFYRRKGWRPITNEQYWAVPENAEMKPFGLGGIKNRETALWFDLETCGCCRRNRRLL
jgi:hypothetical protein